MTTEESHIKLLEVANRIQDYLHWLVVETRNGEHQIGFHTLYSAEILLEDLRAVLPQKPKTLEGTTQQMNTDQKDLGIHTKDSWGFRATFKLDPK